VCVCCVDSLDRARIYIYIYSFEVILSADISSGAHREGFLFEILLFRVSVYIKPFFDFDKSTVSAVLVI
jgi:hypothetical protein